jgi:hypothetical protein
VLLGSSALAVERAGVGGAAACALGRTALPPRTHAAPDAPGLGALAALPDELLLEVAFGLSGADLGRLACTSRAAYCVSHTNDLWKGLVLQVGRQVGRRLRRRSG